MTSTDPKTYTAPCGTDFDTESDARDHEALCDQCDGATEAHETADEMTVTYDGTDEIRAYFDQIETDGPTAQGDQTDDERLERDMTDPAMMGLATRLIGPTHETVSAMFDQTHADNRATIGDIFEMVEDVLDRRDIETARELMADAQRLMDANAHIEACWTVKA